MNIDELMNLAAKNDRGALLVLLHWEKWEKDKNESADTQRLAIFDSLLYQAVEDIQRDPKLTLKRAFWQIENL